MTPNRYGAIAVGNILFCLALGIFMFLPAAFGGFNVVAIATYLGLFTSIVASFYLLANRRDLGASASRRVATVPGAGLLVAVSPMLFGLGMGGKQTLAALLSCVLSSETTATQNEYRIPKMGPLRATS